MALTIGQYARMRLTPLPRCGKLRLCEKSSII